VASAVDGEQALAAGRDRRHDLILLDLMLPGMSGLEVLRTLRREGIETPVIVLSAKGEEVDRVVGLKVGADDYVPKPFSRPELLALYHAAAELERMGDYAVNIAKLAQQLASEPEIPLFSQIPLMERLCRSQLHAAMRALVDVSEADARAVCANDDELDRLYDAVYRSAMEVMQADPSRVPQATHMLFIAHHLERLGDRVTNIGEDVVYLATGQIEDLN